LLTYIRQ